MQIGFCATGDKARVRFELYFRGIAQYAEQLEHRFCSGNRRTPDWLDAKALADCLRQSALGIGNDRIQMDRLNVTLSWLQWLMSRQSGSALEVEDMNSIESDAGTAQALNRTQNSGLAVA